MSPSSFKEILVAHQVLADYITAARKKGHSEDQIMADLVAGGWEGRVVTAALEPASDLPVPAPPPHQVAESSSATPRPVVQTFTTRGLEFIIMFIALGISALALGSALHSSVNTLFGSSDSLFDSGSSMPLASSALIVAFPIFAYLFLRLKRAELNDPQLRRDPSRKRAVQLTLVVTFLVGLGNIIYFVYSLMSGSSSDPGNLVGSSASSSLLGNFVHLVITLAIAGGIFLYYWRDEHLDA